MVNQEKIPILYLDNTATFGGAINSLLYLLRGLRNSRYQPVLVTAQPEEFLRRHFSFISWQRVRIRLSWVDNRWYTRIIRFKPFADGLGRLLIKRCRFLYWQLFVTLPEAVHYWWIGRRHRVRLVHLNNILGSQFPGIIAAKLLRVPCVAHLREFEAVDRVTRLYAKMIDFHVAISGVMKQNLLALGVPEERIAVIHDAIDLREFEPTLPVEGLRQEFSLCGDELLFGIFGRVVPWKGIVEFVKAAALVCAELPTAKAFIVGDCSDGDVAYMQRVRTLVAELALSESIVFTGYRSDVPQLMALMDVVVHSSITPEPFGMVIIEAMAMEKPVVATNIGGPLDIVLEGETGLLVPPADAGEMAAAISRLLLDRTMAKEMGTRGRERVQAMFTKERYASEVETVYGNLLQQR